MTAILYAIPLLILTFWLGRYIGKLSTRSTIASLEARIEERERMQNLEEQSRLQFHKIAQEILDKNSKTLQTQNRNQLDLLLQPIREQFEAFSKQVAETYDKEAKERFSLSDRVRELVEQTNKVSTEANNLANALKGDSKLRGDWGEMILETILEQSGLIKGEAYTTQDTVTDEEGNILRTDVLVHLPQERIVIIDSKVSLNAYNDYMGTESAALAENHLKNHLQSIRNHIDNLASKQYPNSIQQSLDFTMMFIPIEPAYLAAIKADNRIWEYAYRKKILLISPTNLIACLKLIASLWIQEKQSRNAQAIVERSRLMMEKFAGLTESVDKLGHQIEKVQDSYQKVLGQFTQGRGNLVSQFNELQRLGVRSQKEISEKLLNQAELETDFPSQDH
ncbi:MAG: DNA recombination protein RmuC [Bacteroidales bacterium]|nr:DNA recombination protein RmuC [Bacteroidales bacterium]